MRCRTSRSASRRRPASLRRRASGLRASKRRARELRCIMLRASLRAVLLIVVLAGCRLTEREGAIPLPDNAPPLTYTEMVNRARGQATSALDAYYVDSWLELEQAAQ